MWIAKFRVLNKNNPFVELIRRYNLTAFYYPINHYEKKNRHYFIAIGILKGENKNKKRFYSEVKKLKKARKERRLEMLEYNEDFFTLITSHSKNEETKRFVNVFYNPALLHLKPSIIYKNGWEEFEIASLEKKDIEKMIKIGRKIYELELLKIGKKKIKNFGFLTILPELTEKQKKALELALYHGYYKYPRNTSLDKLSKINKLAFSTFQAHIRKAENKIISFAIGSFKR